MFRRVTLSLAVLLGVMTIAQPALAQVSNQGATPVASGALSVAHGLAYAARHDVYLMAYESPSGVQGRFVNAAGATVGSAFMIAPLSGVAYVNKPMVAYSTDTADDVFFVMFATDRGKAFDGLPSAWIQRVTFTGSGGALAGNAFLASDGVYEVPTDIVYNPATRQFVAVWERIFSEGADVLVRFFTAAGAPASGIVNVSNANWSQGAAKAAVDWTRGAQWLPPDDEAIELRYRDPKKMGKVYLLPPGVEREVVGWADLGPDADDPELDLEAWEGRIKRHNGELQNLLKKQAFVAGIGNAYRDIHYHDHTYSGL